MAANGSLPVQRILAAYKMHSPCILRLPPSKPRLHNHETDPLDRLQFASTDVLRPMRVAADSGDHPSDC